MAKTLIRTYTKKALCKMYDDCSRDTLLDNIVRNNVFEEEELKEYKRLRRVPSHLVKKIFDSPLGYPEL